jgi:uncharacterized membrane protein YbhN (UPF0104 family)
MERLFQILAAVLAGIAAFFLVWRNDAETAFIAAVLGAVSFFLSIRFQVKERLKQREAEKLEQDIQE